MSDTRKIATCGALISAASLLRYGYGATEAIATRLGDPTIMVRTRGLVSPLDAGTLKEIGVPLRWWRVRAKPGAQKD